MKVTVIPVVFGELKTIPKMFGKEARRVGNRTTNRNHSNYSIVEIGENPETSPGDLRKLAVTRTPVKDHQLTLV